MKVQDFTGGLNTRLRPQFLPLNAAAEYNNIDNSVGTLAPIKTNLPLADIVDKYFYYFRGQAKWVSSLTFREYIEFQKRLFYTDRQSQIIEEGVGKLVIAPPTSQIQTSVILAPATPTVKFAPSTAVLYDPAGYPAPYTDPLPLLTDIVYAFVADEGTGVQSNAWYVRLSAESYVLSLVGASAVATLTPVILGASTQNLAAQEIKQYPATAPVNWILVAPHIRSVVFSDPRDTNGAAPQTPTSQVKVYRQYNGKLYYVATLGEGTTYPITFEDLTYNISGNDLLDESLFANLIGTYKYAMSFYNSSSDKESALSPISSDTVLTGGGKVNLVGLEVSSDPQVDKKRIYRIGGLLTAFSLVAEIDNSVTLYEDDTADADIPGDIAPQSAGAPASTPPPDTLRYLTKAYAMLFGASEDKLYFTPVGKPTSWPAEYYLLFDDTVTGIAPVTAGILVMTATQTHLVTGNGPNTLAVQIISSDQGCKSFESIQLTGGSALWVSDQGVCVSSGSDVKVLSRDALGAVNITPVSSALHDEVYYVLDATGNALAFDFRYAKIFKHVDLDAEVILSANGKLYGWKSNVLNELLVGATNRSMTYLSPRFIEGSCTEIKSYKTVYVYSTGNITVEVLIDDVVVITRVLTTTDSHAIQIPELNQRGFYIQLRITGTGEVFEYEYVAGRRGET